jgi:hypothetical protein
MGGVVRVSALLLPERIEGRDEDATRMACILVESTKRIRGNIDPEGKCSWSGAYAIVRGPVRIDFVCCDRFGWSRFEWGNHVA